MGIAPIQAYLVSLIAKPNYLGSYYGARGVSILSIGISPILSGMIYQHSLGTIVFLYCATVGLLVSYTKHRVFHPFIQRKYDLR